MAIKRNAAGKIIAKRFSIEKLERAAEHYDGFCRACGARHEGIDPDGRKCLCEVCGLHQVYGAEELALMTV